MSKTLPKPRKDRKAKAANADLPAPIPPRTPEEEALVAAWKGAPRLARPPKFKKEPNGLSLMGTDVELAHARLDRVFCGTDANHTGQPARPWCPRRYRVPRSG